MHSHTHNWLRVPAIQEPKPRPPHPPSPQAFADPPPPPRLPPPSAPPAGGRVRPPPVLSSLYPADDCGTNLKLSQDAHTYQRAEQESRRAHTHARTHAQWFGEAAAARKAEFNLG